MTVYRYRHVSEWPRVYNGLRHGIEAVVHRFHDPEKNPEPPEPPAEGSTVLLQAGDEIETAQPLDHPHLQPANPAAVKAAADAVADAGTTAAAALQVLADAAAGAAAASSDQAAATSGDPEPTGESK